MKQIESFILLSLLIISTACNNSENGTYVEESGNIEVTNIILSSQTSGKVENLIADEGDKVSTGDTLSIIDHDILSIKLQQAQAGMNAAKAQLDLAITGAREEDIKFAEEQLFQTKSNFELAEKDLERMKNLLDEQAVTKKQFDDANTRYLVSKSQYNAAAENLRKIKNITRPEEITQIRSNFQNSESNVKLIKKQIDDCHITSPIDGFIVERFVEMGESVNYGSSLFKVSDLSTVEMVVYVNEENLGKVKLGQLAEVQTDSFKDKVYEGKVVFISPEAEFTPKNIQTKDERTKLVFAVKIKLPNKDFELKAGMPADARIKIKD